MSVKSANCVLLADRHLGLTEGVRGLLETTFSAVVMVADENSLFESAERLRPSVAVVELSLVKDESLKWMGNLRSRCPDMKLIVISVHDESSVRRRAMDAGADGFVLKWDIATDLLSTIDDVLRTNGKTSGDGEK